MSEEFTGAPETPQEPTQTDITPTQDPIQNQDLAPSEQQAESVWHQNYLDSITDEGDRSKKEKVLSRFKSPEAMIDSFFNAQNKIRTSQNTIAKPDENSSEEDVAAWREANSIPNDVADYQYELPEGMIIGQEDKDIIDSFRDVALSNNIPQDAFNAMVNFHYNNMEQQNIAEQQMFEQQSITAEQVLRKELGGDFDRSVNHLSDFLQNNFGEHSELLEHAIGGDGVPLMSNPAVVRMFMNIANEQDPIARVMPMGRRSEGNIQSEIEKIEQRMKTDRAGYFKDAAMQSRHRELLAARKKLK